MQLLDVWCWPATQMMLFNNDYSSQYRSVSLLAIIRAYRFVMTFLWNME